jgi:hypothetical protein
LNGYFYDGNIISKKVFLYFGFVLGVKTNG